MIDPEHLTQVIFREDSIITTCVDGKPEPALPQPNDLAPNYASIGATRVFSISGRAVLLVFRIPWKANFLRDKKFLAKQAGHLKTWNRPHIKQDSNGSEVTLSAAGS